MTVNEFIEHLKSLGDDKWRDMAEVRVIKDVKYENEWNGAVDWGTESEPIDIFDVKGGVNSVDIHIEEEY